MEICPKVIAPIAAIFAWRRNGKNTVRAVDAVAINVAESCSRVISDIYFRGHSPRVTVCLGAIESQRVEF